MKIITFFLIFFFATTLNSQNHSLEFQSLTASAGIYNLEEIKDRIGVSGSLDAVFSLDINLFAATLSFGYGIVNRDEVLKNLIHVFTELDLLYGRSLELFSNVNLAVFSGIGFTEQTKLKNKDNGSSITFPVRGKLIYSASYRFSIGLVTHLNFNSQNNIYMYQLLIKYRF